MHASSSGRYRVARAHSWAAFTVVLALSACAPSHIPNGAVVERSAVAAASPADSVLTLYFDAVGGLSAIRAVETRRMRGTYSEGSLVASTDIAWRRPMVRRVNVHAPGFDYSEGFDGSTWEYSIQRKHLVIDTGAAADAGRGGAEFDESVVDYAAKGHGVEQLCDSTLEGRDVTRIRVLLADGWEKEYFFDPRSHLIVALRKAMPLHATGPAVVTVTRYDDWRRVGRVLTPFRSTERNPLTGQVVNTLQWDTIETDVELGAAELCRPEQATCSHSV